jgi:NitT/TauT family transport system ATP-binding protein
MPDPSVVRADSLGVTFSGRLTALTDINFSIDAGQFVSLVGPSGCGKSTLLRVIAGLVEPTTGSMTVAGLPPRQARAAAVPTSFVFQDATLLPWRSVADNVGLPLELHHQPLAARGPVIEERLAMVGLKEFGRRYPSELSGGMRMRASLARALVTRPRLLLLDEPFGALDDISRQLLNEELLELWTTERFTAVFVTHNISEAVFLSQRILVMSPRPGRIAADIAVPFPMPRAPELRADAQFARLVGDVSTTLRRSWP